MSEETPGAAGGCPRLEAGMRLFPIHDELVVLTPDDEVVGLNASARGVLELCDGRRSATEIGCLLASRHEASASDVASEVLATLRELSRLRLIAFVEGDAAPR